MLLLQLLLLMLLLLLLARKVRQLHADNNKNIKKSQPATTYHAAYSSSLTCGPCERCTGRGNPAGADAAPRLVPYRLLQRLIVERSQELGLMVPGARYKFRLGTEASVDFESEEHEL